VSASEHFKDIQSYRALPKEATTSMLVELLPLWAKKLDMSPVASSGVKIFQGMRFILTGIGDSSIDRYSTF
jgi:hypothetical protein